MMVAASLKSINHRIILCSAMLLAFAASASPALSQSGNEREFVGTINNTLRIHLKLSRADKVLSGSYVYEKIGKNIRLNGAMTDENEFYLDEFNDHDVQTGKFDAKFVSKDWIEGTWSSTKTKKEMPFSAW